MSDIAKELRERSLRASQEGEPLALLDEAADLIERLRDLVSRCNIECGTLHHQKGEYHEGWDRCPVVEKFRDIIGQAD
jgi:hypothetical protein